MIWSVYIEVHNSAILSELLANEERIFVPVSDVLALSKFCTAGGVLLKK